jgi:NAD(P)H-dependent FMN reductase
MIAVLIGSGRRDRFAQIAAQWVVDRLSERGDLDATTIDIRDFAIPFYDELVPPMKAPRVYSNDEVNRFASAVDGADGFVIVTPEYNHGYPAQLKNALDYLHVEFNRKAAAFVSYGNVGGARAIEQLRLVAIELELAPIRHSVNIFGPAMQAARAHPDANNFAELNGRFDTMVDDLMWWTTVLAAARGESTPPGGENH